MTSVYVIGYDLCTTEMFKKEGFEIARTAFEADLLCFTGGADVDPRVYNEEFKGARGCDLTRDFMELGVFNIFRGVKPLVGICRGGQLLNVLLGGEMVQDHGLISGDVLCRNTEKNEDVEVRVDHHQGIIPCCGWHRAIEVLLEKGHKDHTLGYSVFYPFTRTLCFQPHPEWGHEGTKKIFFEHLKRVL